MTWTAQQVLVDRYELIEKIGRTGAGRETWLACDRQTQDKVIVKLLAFSPQMQWDELKLFEREAQVLQALDHPRIPRYYDYFSIDDQLLWFGIVQEYIPGGSLQELLDQEKTMNESEVKQLADNLLQVLDYLHQFDPPMLHRDIKPSNIILGDDGLFYLVDFGAVQNQATLTGVTFTVVGTCGYAPLEQFWGRAVPASDLYALGATLIHLVTGRSPVDLPQRNSRIEFAEIAQLSSFFTAWLEKLTETALEKRFSSAHEALQMLRAKELGMSLAKAKPPARKLSKPDRSRIQLHHLEMGGMSIHLPSLTGWGALRVVKLRDLALGYLLLVLGGMVGRLLVPFSSAYLGSLIFALLLGSGLVYFLAMKSCANSDLRFEGDRLFIEQRTFRFLKPQKKEIRVSDIIGVFTRKVDNRHHVILTLQSNHPDEKEQYIVLHDRKTQTVSFSNHYDIGGWLNELEAIWLVQEIQNWLSGRD
jgi:serine/threonine protein kinase